MSEDETKAALKLDGMLATVVEEFRPYFRAEFPEWFEFVERLNRLGMRVMNDNMAKIDGHEIRDPISLSIRLMTRAAHAYGTAVMLAERGLTIEADTISRTIYETGFWLGYLAKAPKDAAEDFMTEEMQGQLGRDKASRDAMADDPHIVAHLDDQIAKVAEHKKGRRAVPRIADIAANGGFPDHYAYYKVLCGVSAHPTLSSTHGYLSEQDEEGFYGLAFGPDSTGIGKSLGFASHAYTMCIVGHAGLCGFGKAGEIQNYIVDLNGLMERTT